MTRKRKQSEAKNSEQSARFIEAAKKAQADERPEVFEKEFKHLKLRSKPPQKRS